MSKPAMPAGTCQEAGNPKAPSQDHSPPKNRPMVAGMGRGRVALAKFMRDHCRDRPFMATHLHEHRDFGRFGVGQNDGG
jgi:hypothetical protein